MMLDFKTAPPRPNSICVAICSMGQVRIEHELVVANSVLPMGQTRLLINIIGHTTVDARNLAVHYALESQCKFLMFWDDDVIPRDMLAIQKLTLILDHFGDIDILGGVYPTRATLPEPIVVKNEGEGAWWGWEDGKIHEVYMTGTGLTIFRLSSLAKLDVPQYEVGGVTVRSYFAAPNGLTDDCYFAAGAKEQGLVWAVAGDVIADQIALDGSWFRIEDGKVGERA